MLWQKKPKQMMCLTLVMIFNNNSNLHVTFFIFFKFVTIV